jgi:transitional endoplasmic reticulum ATPase
VPRTTEAELHFSRGLLHLRKGEAILPPSMTIREEKTPPGVDVFLALVGLATVATSKALGQTGWIEAYRAEMRASVADFERAAALAPDDAEVAFRKAQAHRYLGEAELARNEAERAARLEPRSREYALLARSLAPETSADAPAPPPARPTRPASKKPAVAVSSVLTWDDIVLPARTKRELRQVQLLLENPGQASLLGVEPPTGLLLYGPPGTGKTTIARVLAAQTKCRFFTTSPAEVHSMWIGEGEKAVAKLFAEARAHAPSILFLDEIDALIPSRMGGVHQPSDKIVNQFLHEMDGLVQHTGVFFIGATNRADMVDPALLRGGRLSRKIEIPLPDESARRQILEIHTGRARLAADVDLEMLAQKTEGFSGADLRALVNEAGMQALIRLADGGGEEAVTAEDFVRALENLAEPES